MDETNRRREKQLAYNQEHGITPRTIVKSVEEIMQSTSVADAIGQNQKDEVRTLLSSLDHDDPQKLIAQLEAEMLAAARLLDFERAASLRDRIEDVQSALAEAAQAGVGGVAPLARSRHGAGTEIGRAPRRRGQRSKGRR
jgi:excinuclease ABC subunit B